MLISTLQKLENAVNRDTIIAALKQNFQFRTACNLVLHQRIISEAAASRDLTVEDEEIQQEMDSLRREMQLERAADTLSWLDKQGISPESWEAGIRDRLLAQKLKHHLFDAEIEKYFHENRLRFDKALLYQIVVPYHQLAQELFYQIEEEEISFFEAAHFYDIDEARRYRCGYEGFVNRQGLPAAISAALFSASAGELVGPIQTETGHHLLLCELLSPAALNDEVRDSILESLFQEWLTGELNYLLQS